MDGRMYFQLNYSRRAQIREILVSQPFTALSELEAKFPDVSSMTLRRDIEFFEQQGDVIKVRGGARSMKFITTSMEESFTARSEENQPVKDSIARRAAGFIESGRSIFLDSGTTMMEFTKFLPDTRLIITTSGPNVAIALAKHPKVMVNLVGGLLSHDNLSLSGGQSIDYINKINIDIAFISPSGFSIEGGGTCGNYSESELKNAVIKKAKKVVLLLDSAKLGKNLPFTFCDFGDIDVIVTERALPAEVAAQAKQAGIRTVVSE